MTPDDPREHARTRSIDLSDDGLGALATGIRSDIELASHFGSKILAQTAIIITLRRVIEAARAEVKP